MNKMTAEVTKLPSRSGGVGGGYSRSRRFWSGSFLSGRFRGAFLVLLILLTFRFSLLTSDAQVRFGLKGGFQLAQMAFNGDALDESNRMGFFAGPTLKIGLPIAPVTIDASALYEQHELEVQDKKFQQQSLVLRGDARLGAGIGEMLGIFLLGGPQFSFNVGKDIKHWFSDDGELKQFSLQQTMLSFNLGVGATFANHFEVSVNYNIPIGKTADFTWQELGNQLQDQSFRYAKTHTNAWSVSASYFF